MTRTDACLGAAGASILRAAMISSTFFTPEQRTTRQLALPVPTYDDSLPVCARREEIRALIEKHPVVVVAGETGSGKTTQLPKLLLELGRGVAGYIGHTQPRRLAARAVASRIAQELGTALGAGVGYQVRFTDQVSERSYIKLMTDGILLAEIRHDPLLRRYDALIIDEAHERSLNIDFLLGYLKRILPKRPDLKLVITSATIDVERFAKHFADANGDPAPVIEVSGRTFPVETVYRPHAGDDEDRELDLPQAVDKVLAEIRERERVQGRPSAGDVLVFCTGERDIRELHAHLKKSQRGIEILPLYARLSAPEQNRIFAPHSGRRLVLATNVAETSVTVPGIGYVIDPGQARISRYNARSRVQRLPVEAISQASARQRAGRCGRIAAGTCFRLYEEADFLARPAFTDPEVRRTNLAAVILQMLALGLGDIEQFPFIDPPERRYVQDGWKLLAELGAVDAQRRLTAIGRQLSRLPVDPRLARMLVEAAKTGALSEMLVIVSALAVQDPRERPHDQQQAADEAHAQFVDKESDFLWFMNAWHAAELKRQDFGSADFKRWCARNFLSFLRLREWRETHHQLRLLARELSWRENELPADYTTLHKALLSGLLGNVFLREEGRDPADKTLLGTHGRRYTIWPGSVHAKKGVSWGVSAEIIETKRTYARTVARVQAGWIEQQAKHLLRRDCHDIHWDGKRGMVMAREQVSLYGLLLHPGRTVHFGPQDPVLARELFIRGALIGGDWEAKYPFIQHNEALEEKIEQMESRLRRRDLRVNDDVLFAWFDERLPADIFSAQKFDAWYRVERRDRPELLCIDPSALMVREPDESEFSGFPERAMIPGATLDVVYRFEPGHDEDGASLVVPLAVLNQVQTAQLDWLVPGLLRDRCVALVKSLPKDKRRALVPVPDVIAAVLPHVQAAAGTKPLLDVLATELRRVSGTDIRSTDFSPDLVPAVLLPNLRVTDVDGVVLARGRDPVTLRQQLGEQARQAAQAVMPTASEQVYRYGDFPRLPVQVEKREGDLLLKSFPALVDAGDCCRVRAFADEATARIEHRRGLRRLFVLHGAAVIRPLRRSLPGFDRAAIDYRVYGSSDELLDEFWLAVADLTFMNDEKSTDDAVDMLREGAAFCARWDRERADLQANAHRLLAVIADALQLASDLRQKLAALSPTFASARADMTRQLDALLQPHFVANTPVSWLLEFPRYCKAMQLRLEKLPGQRERDLQQTAELQAWDADMAALRARLFAEGRQSAELETLRWMIEEYRVSLYAQVLGTRMPVSSQRLARQRERIS